MLNFNENTVFFAVVHHGIFVSFAVVVVGLLNSCEAIICSGHLRWI